MGTLEENEAILQEEIVFIAPACTADQRQM
jgi:hypothetical protein